MEINIKGKSYKIAWEFLIAPFLIILVIAFIILSNFSNIKYAWIEYSDEPVASPSQSPVNSKQKQEEILSRQPEEPDEGTEKPGTTQSPLPSNTGKININKAGMEELMTLPFIGEIKASAIIEYRKSHGPFKTIEDLDNVKGIGSRTIDKLRPLVTVD